MKTKTTALISSFLLFITAMIWGFAFSAQKAANDYYGPFTILSLRSLIAAAALFPVAAVFDRLRGTGRRLLSFRGGKPHLDITKTEWIGGVLCGIALGSASLLQQVGLAHNASSGKTAFLTALYVVLVPLFGLCIGRRTRPVVWCGAAGALVGAALLAFRFDGSEGLSLEIGDALVFACAAVFSLHILIIDHFSPRADGIRLSAIQFLFCGIASLPALFFEPLDSAGLFAGLPSLLFLGLLSSGVAYTLQILVQKHVHPAVASIIMSLESVFGVLGGMLFFGESMSRREYIGCAVLFAAVVMTGLMGTDEPTPAPQPKGGPEI